MRNQPSCITAAVRVRLALVAVEQHRPAQLHLAVVPIRTSTPVERVAVVHAAAAGLAHPVGLHDPDAAPSASPRTLGCQRPAADQDGVEAGQVLDVGPSSQRAEELGRAPARGRTRAACTARRSSDTGSVPATTDR